MWLSAEFELVADKDEKQSVDVECGCHQNLN